MSRPAIWSWGEAGRLVGILAGIRDRAELPVVTIAPGRAQPGEPAAVADDGQDGEPAAGQISIAEALARIMLMICAAWYRKNRHLPPLPPP